MTRARSCSVLIFVWALAFGVPLAPSRAHAQTTESTDDAARRHFRLGQAHYENGEFAEAATEFDEAYRLSQRPQLLYNIYVSYRDAGDLPHASVALRSYLDQVPDAENGAQLRARLASMERILASTATTTTTEPVTPTVTSTETTTTVTETTPIEPPPPAPSSGGGVGSSPVGWIVGGVGAAMMIAGIATGVATLDAQSSLDTACGADRRSCPPGYESQRDSGRSLALATDVLLIGGGVVLATGIVLLFLVTEGGGEAPPVTASCGPDGCSASLVGQF